MRHFPAPRVRTLRLTAVGLAVVAVFVMLVWTADRSPLLVVLAAVAVLLAAAALGVAREPKPNVVADPVIHLDRGALPGEEESDHRLDVDALELPTVGALTTWLHDHAFLPTPVQGNGRWLLRVAGRRVAQIFPSGQIRELQPAAMPLIPGTHVSAQWVPNRRAPSSRTPDSGRKA